MIKIFKDIFSYYYLKKKSSNFSIGFFCENGFIYEYLKPYILNKSKKKKILVISFEKLDLVKNDNICSYTFYTNFFRELVFLSLKLKYLYSSTPNLNNTIFKKSKFFKCKYIYLQHSPVSLTMVYNQNAFDSFDAVQTVNIYQLKEMKEIIEKKQLRIKVFKGKYLFLRNLLKKNINKDYNLDLLIAPSWNSNFYKLNCHAILRDLLLKNNINYVLRPHPMSFKKKEISLNQLKKLNIPFDISTRVNLNNIKFLISDWSGIFIEYAILTNRKAILINTPKKILNENYENYKQIPMEISLRNILGKTFEINELEDLVKELIQKKKQFDKNSTLLENDDIRKCVENNFFI